MKKLLWLSLVLSISHTTHAKAQFSFRKLLNPFHVNFSVGYGRSRYTYQLSSQNGTTMYKERDKFYVVYKFDKYKEEGHMNARRAYLIRWRDGRCILMQTYTDLDLLPEEDKVDGQVKFTGAGNLIPITLSSYVDLWGKLRLGIGGTLFISTLESLKFQKKDQEDEDIDLGTYKPNQKINYHIRPFGTLGYKFVENDVLSLIVDVNFGVDFVYANLSDPAPVDIFLPTTQNIGITLEKHISEYVRAQLRLSYERGDLVNLLIRKKKLGIVKEFDSILLQIGLSFNLPELPRCPLPNCRIEVKHKHQGKPYRGVAPYVGKSLQGKRLYKKQPRNL